MIGNSRMLTRILFVQEVPETGCVLILAPYRGGYKDRLDASNDLNLFEQQRQKGWHLKVYTGFIDKPSEVYHPVHTGY